MKLIKQKKLSSILFLFFIAAFFLTCKKHDTVAVAENEVPADFSKTVIASVSGFVTNESNMPLTGAAVKYGISTTTTDKYGYFEIKNATVTANAAFVTVTMNNYFKGFKTFIATEGKFSFCRIKLIPKTITGTIDAISGGAVELSNGLKVLLPANAVVNASTNVAYTGVINVSSFWADPTEQNQYLSLPGGSWGIDKNGAIRMLKNYGMAAVELTSNSGELLQIAAGKKATITLTIPASLAASAPTTIPLWYLDESKGYCIEEGFANKTGNTYTGEVAHFSYWYCYHPQLNQTDYLKCRLTDISGNPIKNASVAVLSTWMGPGYTTTDDNGILFDYVAPDVYQLDVLDNSCVIYSTQIPQNFVPFQLGALCNMGDVIIPATSLSTITGNVINCNSMPVSNGYVMFSKELNNYNRIATSNTGTFSILTTFCSNNPPLKLIAEDIAALQQSNIFTFTPASYGNSPVGTLRACDISTQQFFNYSIDGISYSFTSPQDHFMQDGNSIGGSAYSSIDKRASFTYDNLHVTPGSSLSIYSFQSKQSMDTLIFNNPVVAVNITEFGAVNEFISGYFSGIFISDPPANTPHTITCNFRVRRNF